MAMQSEISDTSLKYHLFEFLGSKKGYEPFERDAMWQMQSPLKSMSLQMKIQCAQKFFDQPTGKFPTQDRSRT